MRTALYARYSTDLQSASSIEDQVHKLKGHAHTNEWQLAGTYSDAATSGASMLRSGLQALLTDAATAKFDIVLCEALDRLSRNQADIARIYEQLNFHGIKLVTLSEGIISELHIGLKGTMNAIFLKDLAAKTRRGLEGRIRSGKSGGGKSYGYDIPVKFDDKGERITGDMAINDLEAATVTRIFEMYASGLSPRAIAHTLNGENIKGPNGKSWGPSTINGNRKRGTGILNNELYMGKRIWNRLSYIKDPATGKRVSRLNPQDEWIIQDVPELRIISAELWKAAKARQKTLNAPTNSSNAPRPFHAKQRAKYFWSSKIKCGECGGSYTKINKDMLGCATSRNKGTTVCSNRKNLRVDTLEDHLLHSLEHHLMDPALFEDFIEAFTKELNRLQAEAFGNRKNIEARIAKIDSQLSKVVNAILEGADALTLNAKMKELEAEKAVLQEQLASLSKEPPMLLHPNMAKLYKEKVASLSKALKADKGDREAFEAIRSLLDKVTLTPTEEGFDFDIEGELAAILSLSSNGKTRSLPNIAPSSLELRSIGEGIVGDIPSHGEQDKQSSAAGNISRNPDTPKPSQLVLEGSSELAEQVKMVAGVGFEPTTFRLTNYIAFSIAYDDLLLLAA